MHRGAGEALTATLRGGSLRPGIKLRKARLAGVNARRQRTASSRDGGLAIASYAGLSFAAWEIAAVIDVITPVVGALRCAVEVQRVMPMRDADVPQNSRVEFCVGINMGDIIIDEGDIHGTE